MKSDGEEKNGPRWGAKRRLEFIEFRLYWQGALNRKDLRQQFRISDQQASADIAAYQEAAPGNCEYDRKAKTYVLADDFKPLFGEPDAQVYLNELRSVDYRIRTRKESWIGQFPEFGTVPYPKRSADVALVRRIVRAINLGEAIEMSYQSLTRPTKVWRWISPHALGYDGHRWHARAFCHNHGDFRDFVLGRVFEIRETADHDLDVALDLEWTEEINLEIGTHPGLPDEQRAAVEIDHEMTDGRLSIPVRVALSHYLMRWMRVDLDPLVVDPQQIQIVLLNLDAVKQRKEVLQQETRRRVADANVSRFQPS